MEDAAVVEEQQETTQTEPQEKRKRGRPLKIRTDEERAEIKLANDITAPRYRDFNSDSANKNQKTSAAWGWADSLPAPMKEIADLTVYRDWPVTLEPLEESDAKSIDKILGSDPNFPKSDQSLVDRYGAGDYRCYFNVNPKAGPRRLLFRAFVKCTHDFRDFPPTDRRIDNVANVDLSDKSNGSYIAWLKATGKLKDEDKESKEKEEMATATAGVTELLGRSIERGDRLMEKFVEVATTDKNADSPAEPSTEAKLEDTLRLWGKVRDLTQSSLPQAPNATDMINGFVAIHKTLTESNNNAPLLDRISALEKEVRDKETAMLNDKLNNITEQLRALKETPPAPNVLLPDGSKINDIIQRAVEKFADKAEPNPWIDIATKAMPIALPILGGILQRFMTPPVAQPAPFPQPPPNYQAGAMPQQQAQLPAPTPQPQPVAQPQAGGAYTTGNGPLDQLLMMIQIPLADHLRDNASGGEFAEYFIETFGLDTHTQLATFGPDAIVNILYAYPPLGMVLKPLARETVVKFVNEFVAFKPSTEPAGGAA